LRSFCNLACLNNIKYSHAYFKFLKISPFWPLFLSFSKLQFLFNQVRNVLEVVGDAKIFKFEFTFFWDIFVVDMHSNSLQWMRLGIKGMFLFNMLFWEQFLTFKEGKILCWKDWNQTFFFFFFTLSFPRINVSNCYLIVCMYAQVAEAALLGTPFPPQQHRKSCSIGQDFS
jgi:hypothetical protein